MRNLYLLATLGIIVVLGVASAQAQTLQYPAAQPSVASAATDPSVARIAYLEDKVANLESSVQGCRGGESCCDDGCGNRFGISRACCTSPGIIGGFDFLVMKPHFSSSTAAGIVTIADETVDYVGLPFWNDYEMAPRFWLGYKGETGLGGRIRYMQFDHNLVSGSIESTNDTVGFVNYFNNVTGASWIGPYWIEAKTGAELTFSHGMEMHVLDLDVMQDLNWGCTQLTIGGGLRYTKLAFNSTSSVLRYETEERYVSTYNSFEGVGPTVFLDVQRRIGQSALSIVGGARGSVLFGRSNDYALVADRLAPCDYTVADRGDRTTGSIEGMIGLQYDRCLTRGVDTFVRAGWEGQLWFDVGSPTQTVGDMGMEGFFLSIGITR